jgi:hypothetical protein
MKRLIPGLPFLFTAVTLLAQDVTPDATAGTTPVQLTDAQAAGVVAAICGMGAIPIVISVALWLWAAIWVTKDANRRQSPNAGLVKVLTWIPFTWFIGWIIHLVTRPKTIPGAPNP